jgi:hypothetical protein
LVIYFSTGKEHVQFYDGDTGQPYYAVTDHQICPVFVDISHKNEERIFLCCAINVMCNLQKNRFAVNADYYKRMSMTCPSCM